MFNANDLNVCSSDDHYSRTYSDNFECTNTKTSSAMGVEGVTLDSQTNNHFDRETGSQDGIDFDKLTEEADKIVQMCLSDDSVDVMRCNDQTERESLACQSVVSFPDSLDRDSLASALTLCPQQSIVDISIDQNHSVDPATNSRNLHLTLKKSNEPNPTLTLKSTCSTTSKIEGIFPPLSPDASMVHSTSTFSRSGMSRNMSIDTPDTPLGPFSSISNGIHPPLSPDASTIDTLSTNYANISINDHFANGIIPTLSPQTSSDSASGTYDLCVPDGIYPSLSSNVSVLDSSSEFYANIDEEMADAEKNFTSLQNQFTFDRKNSEPYKSYDTVNISSDEDSIEDMSLSKELCSIDDGSSEATLTDNQGTIRKKPRSAEQAKTVRQLIKASFVRVTSSMSPKMAPRKNKYSSVGSNVSSSSSEASGVAYSPPNATHGGAKQFAAQLSKSIKNKILRTHRRSDCGPSTEFKVSQSEAMSKSRSLPIDKNIIIRCSSNSTDRSLEKSSRSSNLMKKFTSPRKPSFNRSISKSQPTTPEMSRKNRVNHNTALDRASVNAFINPRHVIRDPFSLHNLLHTEPAAPVKSPFFTREKSIRVKHSNKPTVSSDHLNPNFARMTFSTKSLMSGRDSSYIRPLVKSIGYDAKPPIASRPAPHHSSENINRIKPRVEPFRNAKRSPSLNVSDKSPAHRLRGISVSNDNSPLTHKSFNVESLMKDNEKPTNDDFLVFEVCEKCRRNVADGLQHPSIWTLQPFTSETVKMLKKYNSKKKNFNDCKMQ